MGISELWNDRIRPRISGHPAIALGIAGTAALVAVIFGVHTSMPQRPRADMSIYYTSDDGKTLFQDNEEPIPPFAHGGGEAVRAYLIPGRDPGPGAIWYLFKWTDKAKAIIDANLRNGPGPGPGPSMSAQLVKRPGDASWVPRDDPRADGITAMPQ